MQFRAQPTSKSVSVSITRFQVKGCSKHSTQTAPNLNLDLNHIHLNKQIFDVAVRKDYLRRSLPVLSATFHFPRILEFHLRTRCSHLIRVTGRVLMRSIELLAVYDMLLTTRGPIRDTCFSVQSVQFNK